MNAGGDQGCKNASGYIVQRLGRGMRFLISGNGQAEETLGWLKMQRGETTGGINKELHLTHAQSS